MSSWSVVIGPSYSKTVIPGSFPVDISADEALARFVFEWPFIQSAVNRASFAFICLYILFTTSMIGTLFMGFLPVGFTYILWQYFGVVFILTKFVKIFLVFSSLTSLFSVVVSDLWVFFVSSLMFLYISEMEDSTELENYIQKELQVLVGTNAAFEHFVFRDIVMTPLNLLTIVNDSPHIAFAGLTYHKYCPSRRITYGSLVINICLCCLFFSRKAYSYVYKAVRLNMFLFKCSTTIIILALSASDNTINYLIDFIIGILFFVLRPFVWLFWHGNFWDVRRFVKLIYLLISLKVLNFLLIFNLITSKHAADSKGFSMPKKTLTSIWTNLILDINSVVDKVALPEFIRSLPTAFDKDAINETQEILHNLGWPEAPKVTGDYYSHAAAEKYKANIIGGTSIRQGIQTLELTVAKELRFLNLNVPEYKRSEQFANVDNELESLSRYFESHEISDLGLNENDVWPLVYQIFQNSKLTPFNRIIHKWEKKYGLGPFWGDVDFTKKWKKLSRRKFIANLGGIKSFEHLWAKTFKIASSLVPVAPISVKGEALPPKKWMNDVVRTVVGSPITHYISSTIWNYMPNHNYKYWTTAIKIGMPLNGFNISKLISEHSVYDNHFEGDFVAFDSTLQAPVLKLIAAVRKKGFEYHRDYAKICFLVDANYSNLEKSPMMTTSTGNIYSKETGLSTGHSSTSMDNSLAAVIYYIAAFKKLTGLSAHEFRYYCKLTNYGDDHVFSWRRTAPAVLNPENIIKVMRSFGVTLKNESPAGILERMSFLSKKWRRPNSSDRLEFEKAGVALPEFVVFHDPDKLVGKAYAPSKDQKADRMYRAKRLISYLYLCAHHQDIYDKIILSLNEVLISNKGKKLDPPQKIPSYSEVLVSWYNPASSHVEEDEDYDSTIISYSSDGLADNIAHLLSLIPDFINPAIYNMGYTNYLLSLVARFIKWPAHLIRLTNGAISHSHLVALLRKSPYDFLSELPSTVISAPIHSYSGLLIRHWIFLSIRPLLPKSRWFMLVEQFEKKISQVNFAINGHVTSVVKRIDVPWLDIALISMLHFIPDIDLPTWIAQIKIPSVTSVFELLQGGLLNYFWNKIPANFKQANAGLDLLGNSETNSILIQAPTGTGKSTTLVATIVKNHGHRFNKIYLVVPRHLLVLTLSPYLRTQFGVDCKEWTEGFSFPDNSKVIVTTAQMYLLNLEKFSGDDLTLVDECHVNEPAVIAICTILRQNNWPNVLMTATPNDFNVKNCDVHIPLTIANTWKVSDFAGEVIRIPPENINSFAEIYRSKVLRLVEAFPFSKFLIFVVDKSSAQLLADRIALRCCILSSSNRIIDEKAQIFISTAVADVGLTIPNVDWVITSNITRTQLPNKDNIPHVQLALLSSLTLTQRRGRTGRTSNGLFTEIRFIGTDLPIEGSFPEIALGIALLEQAIPMSTVALVCPNFVRSYALANNTVDPDQYLSLFMKNYELLMTSTLNSASAPFKFDVNGDSEYLTFAGNIIRGNFNHIENGKLTDKPMTRNDFIRMIFAGARNLADRGVFIDPTTFFTWMRMEHPSVRNLLSYIEKIARGKKPGQTLEVGMVSMFFAKLDPSGKFGRYQLPPKPEDDPFPDNVYALP